MARITTTQTNLEGPIKRDENLIAHSLFVTLVVGAIIGAIALLSSCFNVGVEYGKRYGKRPEPRIIERVERIEVERPVVPTPARVEPDRPRSVWALPANQ